MRCAGVAIALLALVACGRGAMERPLVPALRYVDDGSARAEEDRRPDPPPDESTEALPVAGPTTSWTLQNGLRVVLLERHAFPVVAARLVIDTRAADVQDPGGWRMDLVRAIHLSPPEGVVGWAAGCGPSACAVSSQGRTEQIGEVLGRIAPLVTAHNVPADIAQERVRNLELRFDRSLYDARSATARMTRKVAFGDLHTYGMAPIAQWPTLDDIEALRDRAFAPAASLLVLVGDVTAGAAHAEVARAFDGWTDSSAATRPPTGNAAPPPPPAPDGPHVLLFSATQLTQVQVAIVARGPAPSDQDAAAFHVITELLGGTSVSSAYHSIREELGAAYSVGSRLDMFPDASMLTVGGLLDGDKSIAATGALLSMISALRNADPAPEALEAARRAAISRWRASASTDAGTATMISGLVLAGLSPDAAPNEMKRIAEVTAAQVQAVARKYLDVSQLRLVLAGDPKVLAPAGGFGLGTPAHSDSFGRVVQ